MIGKVGVLLMRPLQRGPARRITTLHAFALTPDSPFGFKRQARKPQERWRNLGILLSPVASTRTRPPVSPFQRKDLNLCRKSTPRAGEVPIHLGNPGLHVPID